MALIILVIAFLDKSPLVKSGEPSGSPLPENLAENKASWFVFRSRSEAPVMDNGSGTNISIVADAGKDLTVQINEPMQFNSSGSSNKNEIVNYSWTFDYSGEEIHLYGPRPEFIFKEIGYYKVNLTVTDRQGHKSYGEMIVTVENYKEKVGFATFLGIGFAGLCFLGLMVWSFILEIREKRGRKKNE